VRSLPKTSRTTLPAAASEWSTEVVLPKKTTALVREDPPFGEPPMLLGQPVLAEHKCLISVACGTYVFPERKSPAEISKAADTLMYEDKAKKKAGG
jgi:hypothetical protein